MDEDGWDELTGGDSMAPVDQAYRTCGVCGGDCYPDPTAVDGLGVRIAFVCPQHGVHAITDPFEHLR